MEATYVRNLDGWHGDVRLYKLSEPYTMSDWNGQETGTCEYVAVSATVAMFSGPETYVFPCSEDGTVIDWGELPGSFQGSLDHQAAIDDFVAQVAA